MTYEIFLSHNHRDLAWCEHVKREAAVAGVTTYLAEHDVQAGHTLAVKVQRAIKRSRAVAVLISDNSVAAPYVQQEIGYALACRKVVIPLVQVGLEGPALAMLQGVEYIPFDFNEPDDGLALLNANLTRLVERQKDVEDAEMLIMACGLLLVLVLSSNGGAAG